MRQLEPAGVDARGSTPYFGVADRRRRAVRQGARRRRAQRRPAVPPLPPAPAPRPRRREAVLHAAARRRARGPRRARRPRPRRAHATRCGRSPPPTPTATSSPTRRSRAGRSIASTRRGHRRRAGRRSGASSASCGEHRIAHRDLRLANIFLDDDGEVWLIDFGFSEVAASDLLLATDVAELVASSSVYVGAERAVAHAVRHRRPGDAGAGARPAAPVGAQRRDADRAQGPAGSARRAAQPHRPRAARRRAERADAMNLLVADRRAGGRADRRRRSVGPRARRQAVASAPSSRGCSTPSTGCPTACIRVLWLPMQLGNLVVGTAAGLLVALLDGDLTVAIGVVAGDGAEAGDRADRPQGDGRLPRRPPAAGHQPGRRRSCAAATCPSSGPSFPSGHVILVAAVGSVVAPTLPAAWWWVPSSLTVLVMLGRVYVGAHNPLDVTAGLGAGSCSAASWRRSSGESTAGLGRRSDFQPPARGWILLLGSRVPWFRIGGLASPQSRGVRGDSRRGDGTGQFFDCRVSG